MDMQNTSALPDANGSERTLKESIQALAAVIGTLQRREHALDDLVREQLQLLQERRQQCRSARQSRRGKRTSPADAIEQSGAAADSGTGGRAIQQEDGNCGADGPAGDPALRTRTALPGNNDNAAHVDRIDCPTGGGCHQCGRRRLRALQHKSGYRGSRPTQGGNHLFGSCCACQRGAMRQGQVMRRDRQERVALWRSRAVSRGRCASMTLRACAIE